MDEATKIMLAAEYEKRKAEDELFNTMMSNRLARQANMSAMIRYRDSHAIGEIIESDDDEETYTVKLDEDGELDIEKID